MIYLISQEWTNTSKNHAGMKYLCEKLQEYYPEKYKSICIRDYYVEIKKGRIAKFIQRVCVKRQYSRTTSKIFGQLKKSLQPCDRVILMEYFEKLYPQVYLAKSLKTNCPDLTVDCMVHLVPSKLDQSFSQTEFNEWSKYIDNYITLGSSLSDYLAGRGIPKERIITSFHYVDTDFYHPLSLKSQESKNVIVIAMGNQMRNVKLLRQVIEANNNVDFIVCQGVTDLSANFRGLKNIRLIPFVSEEELRKHMNEADISLNVMIDTIGSNVITTSMAMGLAMICSDVGSIRNYCDESNAFFCDNDNPKEWSDAIETLSKSPSLLKEKQTASIKKSQDLSIKNFSKSIEIKKR